jgi:hypothetical protein
LDPEEDCPITRVPGSCYKVVNFKEKSDITNVQSSYDRLAILRNLNTSPNQSSFDDATFEKIVNNYHNTLSFEVGRTALNWIPSPHAIPASDVGQMLNKTFPAELPPYMRNVTPEKKTTKLLDCQNSYLKDYKYDFIYADELSLETVVGRITVAYKRHRARRAIDAIGDMYLDWEDFCEQYNNYTLQPKRDEANVSKFCGEHLLSKFRSIFFVNTTWNLVTAAWSDVEEMWVRQTIDQHVFLTAKSSAPGCVSQNISYTMLPCIKSNPKEIAEFMSQYESKCVQKTIGFLCGDDYTSLYKFVYPGTQNEVEFGFALDAVGMDQSQDGPHQNNFEQFLKNHDLDEMAELNNKLVTSCQGILKLSAKYGLVDEDGLIPLVTDALTKSGERYTSFKNTLGMTQAAYSFVKSILANLPPVKDLPKLSDQDFKHYEYCDHLSVRVANFFHARLIAMFNSIGMNVEGPMFIGQEVAGIDFLRCLWYPTNSYDEPYLFARAPSAFRSIGSFNSAFLSTVRRGIRNPDHASRIVLGAMY